MVVQAIVVQEMDNNTVKIQIKGYIMTKLIVAISMIAVSLMAVDYSQMSMEELNALRGTIAAEDREAFRAEMQSRVQLMTPEEQAKFREERMANKGLGPKDGSGSGNLYKGSNNQAQGMGQRLRDGSGTGAQSQGSKNNQGGGNGAGNGKK